MKREKNFRCLYFFILIAALGMAGCARKPVKTAQPEFFQDSSAKYNEALRTSPLARVQSPAQPSSDYLIGPNDVLEIKVFQHTEMDTTARVAGDGTIRFPVLGVLHAGGLSERQLEDQIQKRLKGEYIQDPNISVFIKEPHAREVAIVGQVKTPGLYPFYGKMSLVELLSKSGGLTEKSGNVAYVIRGNAAKDDQLIAATTGTLQVAGAGPKVMQVGLSQASAQVAPDSGNTGPGESIRIDLNGLLLRGEDRWNIPLSEGDCVTIPDAGWVHITGTGVEKPGTYQLKNAPNTLSQFIDEAGGIKFEGRKTLMLVRKGPDGRDQITEVNYQVIQKDNRKDVLLQTGDTVVVNRVAVKTGLAMVGRALASIFHVGMYYNLASNGAGGY